MKQKNLTLAIFVMVVATLVSVAIMSCKKEDTVAPTGQSAAKAAFTPPQVDDMNAYLKALTYKLEEPFSEHHERFWKEHYELTVGYGQRHEIISEPGHNEY